MKKKFGNETASSSEELIISNSNKRNNEKLFYILSLSKTNWDNFARIYNLYSYSSIKPLIIESKKLLADNCILIHDKNNILKGIFIKPKFIICSFLKNYNNLLEFIEEILSRFPKNINFYDEFLIQNEYIKIFVDKKNSKIFIKTLILKNHDSTCYLKNKFDLESFKFILAMGYQNRKFNFPNKIVIDDDKYEYISSIQGNY
jgi:hypothetical protein